MRKFISNAFVALILVQLAAMLLLREPLGIFAQFKPGDLATPPAAWNTWHGMAPGNKSKVLQVAFSAASNETIAFTWTMDYLWFFTKTGDCSVRARITTTDLAAAQEIDTTTFMYVPGGSSAEINQQWSGIIIKGISTGTLDGAAVGRTF